MSITGTFCVTENADTFAIEAGTLAESYLLALMKRDAKIWKSRNDMRNFDSTPELEMETIRHNSTRETSFTRKRQTKKAQREQERAADEARRAKFVGDRHPLVIMAKAPSIVASQPHPHPKPKSKPKAAPCQRRAGPSARAIALAAGESTYRRETECKKCGGRTFRTGDYTCLECDCARKRNRVINC